MHIRIAQLSHWYTRNVPVQHFLQGMTNIFFNPWTTHMSEIVLESDKEALYNDWKAVGDDLCEAILKYESKG
jgi:hypothetical protein